MLLYLDQFDPQLKFSVVQYFDIKIGQWMSLDGVSSPIVYRAALAHARQHSSKENGSQEIDSQGIDSLSHSHDWIVRAWSHARTVTPLPALTHVVESGYLSIELDPDPLRLRFIPNAEIYADWYYMNTLTKQWYAAADGLCHYLNSKYQAWAMLQKVHSNNPHLQPPKMFFNQALIDFPSRTITLSGRKYIIARGIDIFCPAQCDPFFKNRFDLNILGAANCMLSQSGSGLSTIDLSVLRSSFSTFIAPKHSVPGSSGLPTYEVAPVPPGFFDTKPPPPPPQEDRSYIDQPPPDSELEPYGVPDHTKSSATPSRYILSTSSDEDQSDEDSDEDFSDEDFDEDDHNSLSSNDSSHSSDDSEISSVSCTSDDEPVTNPDRIPNPSQQQPSPILEHQDKEKDAPPSFLSLTTPRLPRGNKQLLNPTSTSTSALTSTSTSTSTSTTLANPPSSNSIGQSFVRLAQQGDVPHLTRLDTVAAYDVDRIQQIRKWVQANQCYVLVDQNVIKAYAVLHHHFFGQAFLEMVMVDPAHRQQGFGLALILHLQSSVSPKKLFSSTNTSNVKMQSLFEKAGFKRSGHVDNLDLDDPELIYVHLGSSS